MTNYFRYRFLLVMLFVSVTAQAEVQISAGYGIGGLSQAHSSGRWINIEQANYFFDNGIGVGGYHFVSDKDETHGRFDFSTTGAEVLYHFAQFSKGRMAGLRLGLAQIDWQPDDDQVFDFTPFCWGVFYRETWFLYSWLGAGFEVNYFKVDGDSLLKSNGSTLELSNFSSFGLQFVLSVWF